MDVQELEAKLAELAERQPTVVPGYAAVARRAERRRCARIGLATVGVAVAALALVLVGRPWQSDRAQLVSTATTGRVASTTTAPAPSSTSAPTSTTQPSGPPCSAGDLVATAHAQGDPGGLYIQVFLANTGPVACVLRGAPTQVQVLGAGGQVEVSKSSVVAYAHLQAVTLAAHSASTATLALGWDNWCGPPFSSTSLRFVPGSGGPVTAPMSWGLATTSVYPKCIDPGEPSSTLVTDAYRPSS